MKCGAVSTFNSDHQSKLNGSYFSAAGFAPAVYFLKAVLVVVILAVAVGSVVALLITKIVFPHSTPYRSYFYVRSKTRKMDYYPC